jgi:hypothetical protein
MFQPILDFFTNVPPPAFDPVFIPWISKLVAGNVIIFGGLWAFLKAIAKATPWAGDDKIIQILTGAVAAVKEAVKKKPGDPSPSESVICPECQRLIDGGP